jgi:hypothetical protein
MQTPRLPKSPVRNFGRNFKPFVKLRNKSQTCEWKNHFWGGPHEIVNWQVLWAKNQPDGFIYCRVPELVKALRYQKVKQRQAEDFLRWERWMGIVSVLHEDDNGRGPGYFGPTQASHDLLCKRTEHGCQFLGWDGIKVPILELGKHYDDSICFAPDAYGNCHQKPKQIAPTIDAAAELERIETKPESASESAVECAVSEAKSAVDCAVECAVECAVSDDQKPAEVCGIISPQPTDNPSDKVTVGENCNQKSAPNPLILQSSNPSIQSYQSSNQKDCVDNMVRLDGWISSSEHLATMRTPNEIQEAWLRKQAAEIDHIAGDTKGVGWKTISDAVYTWQRKRECGMTELKYPWLMFTGVGGKTRRVSEGAPIMKEIVTSFDWRMQNEPNYREFQECYIMQNIIIQRGVQVPNDATVEEKAIAKKFRDWQAKDLAGLFGSTAEVRILQAMFHNGWKEWHQEDEKRQREEAEQQDIF